MDIHEILQQLDTALIQLNELRAEDAGEAITDFKDYSDALEKLKQKYDNNEILAYCPNATILEYDGESYELAVVLGIKTTTDGKKPHGLAHILDKHTYTHDDNTVPTEIDLINATKRIQIELQQATKQKNVLYDPFEHRLIFGNKQYIYVVCLAKDKDELSYLHTLFRPDKPNYIKKQQAKLNRRLQNEIPPDYKHQRN